MIEAELPGGTILEFPDETSPDVIQRTVKRHLSVSVSPAQRGREETSFDVDGARTEGYSDAEIADYLGERSSFDVRGARAEGYGDAEIVDHLASAPRSPLTRIRAQGELVPGASSPLMSVHAFQPSQRDVRLSEPRAALSARAAVMPPARPREEQLAIEQPARAVMSRRGGMRVLPPDPDLETGEFPSAPWTGEGGVLTNLPAALVSGGETAIANLDRMRAEEEIRGREEALGLPSAAEREDAFNVGALPPEPREQSNPLGYRISPRALERQRQRLEEARRAGEDAKRRVEQASRDAALVTPRDMSTEQQALWSIVQSAPPTLLGISVGILTRNPAAAMALAGGGGAALQAGHTYGEAIEKGADHRLASVAASVDAVLEGVGESLPLAVALRPGSAFLTRLGNTVMAESGQEGVTQLAQDLNAFLTYNPQITLGEAWQNLKVAALAGAIGGTVYGTAGHLADQAAHAPVMSGGVQSGAAAAPAAPPPGNHADGRIEPTISRADIERVLQDDRPAREIIAEEDRAAARAAIEPTARAVQQAAEDDLGIMASQGGTRGQDPETFELAAQRAVESDTASEPTPGDRRWTGDISRFARYGLHPRMVAALEPSFVPVYRAAESEVEDRDQVAHELASRIDPYTRLPEASKTKVNAVLELDRLAEKVHLAGKEMSAKNERHRLARLSKVGEKITLSDEEKTAYWAVRRMLDVALKKFRDQVLTEFGVDAMEFKGGDLAAKILDAINPAMTEEQKASYQKAAKFAHEIEQARRRGYVPFTRWGNVVIAVKNPEGAVLWSEKVEVDPVELHKGGVAWRRGRDIRDMPSVKRALESVERQFKGERVQIRAFQVPQGPKPGAMQLDIGELDELAGVAGIEPGQWDAVREKLERALKAKSFRRHFLGSSNVGGYSGDFERAIADYITGMSGYLARRKHRSAWDEAIGGIPAVKRRLQDYATRYRDYLASPQEELQLLRQIGFAYYLAGVPASAIANLTQVPLVSGPYLSQFRNPASVAGELTRAYADVAAMYRPIDSGFEMFDPAAAPEDVREALQEAWARGFFVPLLTYEMQGVAHGRTPYGRKAKRALHDARDAIAYMFSLAERSNRLITFIAAHRLAKRSDVKESVHEVLGKNPLAQAEILGEAWSPARFASWAVDETQFRMGKLNRPPIGRGAGTAILQFKGFMMQMLELWWRMASQNGAHGKAAAAAMMLLWILTAGFWGLPFAEDLRDAWEWLYRTTSKLGTDSRTKLREFIYQLTGSSKLAEIVARGGPAGAGFDLSGRVGLGNIAPDSPLQVLGVPADITVGRAKRAIEHAASDSPELAVAEALPNFLRNPATAASWLAQGVRNRRGDVVVPKDQVGLSDAILRGVGVTPTWISNRRDLAYAEQRVETSINERRDDFYGRFAKARADLFRADRANDRSAAAAAAKRIREVRAELARYNEGRPLEERIVMNDRTLESRIRRELQGPDSRRGKGRVAARPRREQLREIYGVK